MVWFEFDPESHSDSYENRVSDPTTPHTALRATLSPQIGGQGTNNPSSPLAPNGGEGRCEKIVVTTSVVPDSCLKETTKVVTTSVSPLINFFPPSGAGGGIFIPG